MINKQKIKYNEAIYYVPSYTSPRKVSILKLINDSFAVVKPYSKKQNQEYKPFKVPIAHIYNADEDARIGCREWKHYMRHHNKKSKQSKKSKTNKGGI